MTRFVVSRIALALFTLLFVSLIVFLMINAMPGNAVSARLADAPGAKQDLIPQLEKELGLDRPLPVQYADWVSHAVRGDLGKSLWSNQQVTAVIRRSMPITFEIAVLSALTATAVGIVCGVVAANWQNRLPDHLVRLASVGFLSLPSFFIGTAFIVFAAKWFNYALPARYMKPTENLGDHAQVIAVAVVILGLRLSASVARMVRSTMLDVLRQDYIRTARAKGLSQRTLIVRHALRNASLPVITLIGNQFAVLLGGTVVIETLLAVPGMGNQILLAVQARDFPLMQGLLLCVGALLVTTNLLVDLSYGLLDPRIRING